MLKSLVYLFAFNLYVIGGLRDSVDDDWLPFVSFSFRPPEPDYLSEEEESSTAINEFSDENHISNVKEDLQGSSSDFWILRDDSGTKSQENITSMDSSTVSDVEVNMSESGSSLLSDDQPVLAEMPVQIDETISLPRTNCNLEIQVNEWEDKKLQIQYSGIEKGAFGRCQTTLTGNNGILLAVLISNIRFQKSEILSVVAVRNQFKFTVREYRPGDEYYPVILSDTNIVYLIFSFNATENLERSSFEFEVFNYYRNENKKPFQHQNDLPYSYPSSGKDVEKIYFTTAVPKEKPESKINF